MKYILFMIVLFSGMLWAQCNPDMPNAYTPFLGLRLYLDGDNPCADSIRANAETIDSVTKAQNDTTTAVKADVYSYGLFW